MIPPSEEFIKICDQYADGVQNVIDASAQWGRQYENERGEL